MTTLSHILDQIGDWNPQLLRELKGKLTLRNLLITGGVALGFQALIFQSSLFVSFRILHFMIPAILVIVGSYLLSYDLSQEYRNRTLEFIRLTPQSSQEILIGKILGVPILVYLAVMLTIPLHIISSFWAVNHPFYTHLSMLGSYLLWIVQAGIFYLFSLIYTLSILKQHKYNYPSAIIAGSVAFVVFILNQLNVAILEVISTKWYGLDLSQSGLLQWSWLMLMAIIIGNFFWKILNRQFQNFQTTLITKSQSYQMNLFINFFLLGFVIHGEVLEGFSFSWLFVVVPIASLILMVVLSPSYQSLLDWARYGHLNHHKRFWKDLAFGEKSPPILAVLINVLIPTLIWFIALVFYNQSDHYSNPFDELSALQILLCPLMTISMILIYGMITQIFMLNQSKNSKIIMTSVILALIIIPAFAATFTKLPILFIFTPIPVMAFYPFHQGSLLASFIGFGLQLVILGALTVKLKRQIYLVGASETQTLLNSY